MSIHFPVHLEYSAYTVLVAWQDVGIPERSGTVN